MARNYLLLSSFCLLFIITSQAGGFQLYIQGVRQTSMGGTGVSLFKGSSSLFYNPSLLAIQEMRFESSAHVFFLSGKAVYYNPTTAAEAETKNGLATPFAGYVSYKPTSRLALGLGIYVPFASKIFWDPSWEGKFIVTQVSLTTICIQPTFAYQIHRNWSVGGGVVFGSARFNYEREIPISSASSRRSTAELNAEANAVGVNVGVSGKISRRVGVGASFRSGLKYDFKDGETIYKVPEFLRDSFPSNNTFRTTIPTPDVFTIGGNVLVGEKWTLAADMNFNQWKVYDEIKINFRKNNSVIEDIVAPRNYKNTKTYRVGVEYKKNCCFAARAGISYDKTPVQDGFYSPEAPDSDRFVLSSGLSYDFDDHFAVDVSASLVEGKQVNGFYMDENFSGAYKFRATVFAVGLNYVFK